MVSLLLVAALTAQVHAGPAAEFLEAKQQPNGGFITDPLQAGETAHPTLRTTRTALRSFRMLGKKVPHRDQIIAFHAGCYDEKTGGFAAFPGEKPDPISTSVGLMILRELKLPSDRYLERGLKFMNDTTQQFEQIRMVAPSLEEYEVSIPNAPVWEKQLRSEMNADGSFGQEPGVARRTALYGVAIQRLGGRLDRDKTLRVLRAGQLADGGFGNQSSEHSDLESCYRVVRLFHRFGALPDRPDDLRGFIARCKNKDGGYGRTPQQASSLHGTYYATILNGWLDELEQTHVEATRREWTFDDVPPGKLPSGWTVANTLPEQTTHWLSAASGDGRALVQTSKQGANQQFNLCVTDEHRVNVDVSVRIKALSGVIDQGGGVVWRYTDPQHYYIARWNPLENNLRVYKIVEGVRTQLDTAQVPQAAVGALKNRHLWTRHPGLPGWPTALRSRRRPIRATRRNRLVDQSGRRDRIRRSAGRRRFSKERGRHAHTVCPEVSRSLHG